MRPEIHALAGAYVLDAVSDSERAAFEAHVGRCPSCQAEVDELRAVAVRLGGAAAEVPPPALRARVLDLVERTPQSRPRSPLAAPTRRRHVRAVLGAAAAVVVLVVGVVGTVRLDALRHRADRLEAVATVLTAPDAAVVVMEASDPAVTARLVHSPAEQAAVLVAHHLPDPPEDHVYEIWLMDDTHARPAGVFLPEAGQVTELVVGNLDDAEAFAVTVEPGGGSDTPTGDMVLHTET